MRISDWSSDVCSSDLRFDAKDHSMPILQDFMIGRRALVAAGGAATLAGGLGWSAVSLGTIPPKAHKGADPMTYITASDGAPIFYKASGPRAAPPLVFNRDRNRVV